jgi:putative peptidoglycan lipid II flippase
MSLVRSVTTVGGFTIVSRILGLVREIFVAALLGAGPMADAFFMAFKLPNFFRRLLGEGAFNAAFVPLFSGQLATQGSAAAFHTAQQIFSLLFGVLLILVAGVELYVEPIVAFLAPGFAATPLRFQAAIECVRITFPYIFCISLAAMGAGILNSFEKFAAAAATPILLNLIMIFSLVTPLPFPMDGAHRLSWGVLGAGIIQLLWIGVSCGYLGFRVTWTLPTFTPMVRGFLKRLFPGLMGAGALQVNSFIGLILASLLPTGAVSYLFYADRLVQLPLSVIGIATSTALLPTLSKCLRQNKGEEAKKFQEKALFLALGLAFPAGVALVVLAQPILQFLFQRGAFGPHEVKATALALKALAWGLPAYIGAKVLSTIFFAHEDTKTPLRLSLLSVIIDVGASVVLMGPLLHEGIAMATALASWVNALGLAYLLHKRHIMTVGREMGFFLSKLFLACGIMVGLLYAGMALTYPRGVLGGGGWTFLGGEGASLLSTMAVGGGGFLLSAHGLKVLDLSQVFSYFRKRS